jgi:hypothetical protein
MENKREIHWDDVLEELEEWFANGTHGFESMHAGLVMGLNNCENLEKEEIILKKLRVIGFLRGVICWHHKPISSLSSTQFQSQSPPKDQQSPSEDR